MTLIEPAHDRSAEPAWSAPGAHEARGGLAARGAVGDLPEAHRRTGDAVAPVTREPPVAPVTREAPVEPVGPVTDAWLVMPLYNEAQVVQQVIADARTVFPLVVAVDDASEDGSAELARAAGAVVVQHPLNLGQGAALQTGIDYVLGRTDARWVVTFDADGQHSPRDAAAMVRRAREEDLAFVLGSRFLEGPSPVGWLKRLVLRTAARAASRTTGMHLTDAHNGLRVIRRDAAQRLDLRQNRMAHASEIVRELGATGLPWREHPVRIEYTEYSRAKGQSLLNSVNILVDLIFT